MKRFLPLFISIVVCTLVCHADTVWQTGFESGEGYSLGDIEGQQGWNLYHYFNSQSTSTVVNAVPGSSVPEGTQCLWIGAGTNGWSAAIHPVDISGVDTENNYITILLKAFPDADYCEVRPLDIGNGYTNVVIRLLGFLGNLWVAADQNNDGANDWIISGAPGASYQQWHDWKIVLDISRKQIIRIEADTNVWELTNVGFYRNNGVQADTVNRFHLSNNGVGGQSGRIENFYDAIEVATEPKPEDPPTIGASPESMTFGLNETSSVVSVFNMGTGSFSYVSSTHNAATWISFSPTSGTVSASAQVTVNVDHSAVGDGFHRTLALFDAGPAGVVTVSVAMANGKVLYETDFDEPYFVVDAPLLGQDGWNRVGNENEAVVTNLPDSDGPCAVLTKSYNVWWDERFYHPLEQDDTLNNLVKFSCKVRVPADLAEPAGVMDQRYWDPSRMVLLFKPAGDGTVEIIEGYPNPASGRPAVDTWFDISYVLDLALDKLTYMKFGDYEATDLDIPLKDPVGTLYHYVTRFSFYVGGQNLLIENGLAFDDVRVELLDRPAEPELAVAGEDWFYVVIPDTNTNIELVNAGAGMINYTSTVLEGSSWLSIPTPSGIISNQVKQLSVQIDREAMSNDYYYGKIMIDGGAAGTVYAIIAAPNGTVYYATDFSETFYTIDSNLVGQDKWRADGSSVAAVTNYMGSDGACACVTYMDGVWWNLQRFYRDIDTIPENGRIKVSCRFFVPATANEAFFGDGVVDTWGETKGKLQFVVDNDTVNANDLCFNGFTIPPDQRPAVGEWFEAAYVLDLAANLVTYVKVGDYEVSGINLPLPDNNSSKFGEFSFGDRKHLEAFNSMVAIDDIRVETYIPNNPPACMIYPDYLVLGPSENSSSLLVLNDGTGSFSFTAAVIDGTSWLTVTPTSGVVSLSPAQLNVTVDRTGLASGYYRSRVVFDAGAAGMVTSMVCMSQGSVVYETDFSNPWYGYGNLNGQDGWTVNDSSFVAASIVSNIGGALGQCAMIEYMTNWTWDGIEHPAPVDPETIVRISGKFFVPSTSEGFRLVTRPSWQEKINAAFWVDESDQVHVGVNDDIEVNIPTPADEWFDFSITFDMDPAVEEVTEIVLGSSVAENPSIFLLNPTEHIFESISVIALNESFDEESQQGICFDDVAVEIIPEPTAFMLLALAGLLAVRRR